MKEAKGNEVTVSCDGIWQKQGFSSKNGVFIVATVNGLNSKIIDTETLTNHCNKCKFNNENDQTPPPSPTFAKGIMKEPQAQWREKV